jgi:hypothetical protein
LSVFALLLGSVPGIAADPFVGKWVNSDEKAGGLTRLEISKKDKGWTIQAWGAGEVGEVDRGKVTLHLLGDAAGDTEMKSGIASWDHKSKETHFTLRMEKGELVVEDFNVFKDDSGQANYRKTHKLKKDTPAGAIDDATRKKVDQKAAKIVESLNLADAEKAAKVKAIAADWLAVMTAWHKEHDAELNRLWGEWDKARAVVPKDEFPGEVIANQIDAVYASLKPAYRDYIKRLSAELTAEQIDAIKEGWSRSPGMMRTYNAYLEIVPNLTAKDKEVIKARMLLAREAAMLTDSDKEIVAIYKRHKVKVEQYVGTLEWAKLHKAFAERGKSQPDKK